MRWLVPPLACIAATALLYPWPVEPVRVLQLEPVVIAPIGVPAAHQLPTPALPTINIPERMPATSYRYRRLVEAAASRAFPSDPPVALLAAQLRGESAYRDDATSNKGAAGIAQFMPTTARLMGERYPELRPVNPRDSWWAARAQALHMRDLYQLYPAASTECDRWALALCSYNGPPHLCQREQTKAVDPNVWFNSVENVRIKGRGMAAFKESRGYVRRLLLVLEPRYDRAGWSGGLRCKA